MEGQTDIAVFLLLKGEAVVTRNDLTKVSINSLTMGALFGEVSFLLLWFSASFPGPLWLRRPVAASACT